MGTECERVSEWVSAAFEVTAVDWGDKASWCNRVWVGYEQFLIMVVITGRPPIWKLRIWWTF